MTAIQETAREPADQTAADQTAAKSTPAWKRFLPLAVLAAGLGAFLAFGGADYVSLQSLADNRDSLQAWAASNMAFAALVFVGAYIVATALSLPIGTPLTLAGGFIFGTWVGGALVAVGATIGASILFIAARTAFADYFRERVGARMQKMRAKFEENAFFYILALRLAPIFPFVVVNVAPALAGIPLRTYVAATAIGILPGTFVYASVGAGLDAIFAAGGTPDLGAVFQPEVLVPLLLLASLSLAPAIWKRLRKS